VHGSIKRPPDRVKPGPIAARPPIENGPPKPPRNPDERDVAGRLAVLIDPGQVVELRATEGSKLGRPDSRLVRLGRPGPDTNRRLVRRMVVDLATRYSLRLHLIIDDGRADRS
jgi:hypothetical protein